MGGLRAERYYPTRRGREGGNSPGAPKQSGSGGAPTSARRPPNVKPGFHLGSSRYPNMTSEHPRGPARPSAKGDRAAARDHLGSSARARSPSEQAGAEGQREVCAVVAAPLNGDQASRGRHGAPGRQSETSDCGRGPSGLKVKLAVRPRPGPLLSGSSPRQSRRLLSRGDPTAATRAPRSAPTRTPAARRPSALLGSSAPSLPAAPARFKRKRRFKIWR